ncbi:MAG: hypothetical protein CR997_04145 [Acidobacteria bacterium]|nr:MAG: hypothetical protein CR997_04145 [Acidobacteriota bacterium]
MNLGWSGLIPAGTKLECKKTGVDEEQAARDFHGGVLFMAAFLKLKGEISGFGWQRPHFLPMPAQNQSQAIVSKNRTRNNAWLEPVPYKPGNSFF